MALKHRLPEDETVSFCMIFSMGSQVFVLKGTDNVIDRLEGSSTSKQIIEQTNANAGIQESTASKNLSLLLLICLAKEV